MSDDHNAHDRTSDGHDAVLRLVSDAFDRELPAVPERLLAVARDAYTWRLVDAELADLLFDSELDELAGVRGSSERRAFRFGAGDFVIRAHLTAESLVVMVEPPLTVTCRVTTEDGSEEYRTDELGELVVDSPDVPFRIEVDLPSGTTVTPWVTG